MITFLRVAYIGVMLTMFAVTIWASSQVAMWNTPRAVVTHPWFIATLFDTYFAFLIFFAWLIAILALGNFAIGTYMLIQLFRLPSSASMEDLLLRRKGSQAKIRFSN
jgi:hypothetical protein